MSDHEEMTARAFSIADCAMEDALKSNSVCVCGVGVMWQPCNVAGIPVSHSQEADPEVLVAVEWLIDRGLAEWVESPDGDLILMKENC